MRRAPTFRALHDGDPFVIPNPWDAGSAKVLAGLGFEALASTSSGFAFTLGRPDGAATLDEVVEHAGCARSARRACRSRSISRTATDARRRTSRGAIARVAGAGAVGASIEDYDAGEGIYPLEEAAGRVAAAVEAARGLDFPSRSPRAPRTTSAPTPTSRTPSPACRPMSARTPTSSTPPGCAAAQEIRAVCDAVSKPVNVLAHRGLTLSEIVEAGGQRISVGGALTWVAVGGLVAAAERIRDDGDFSALVAPAQLGEWLSAGG